MTSAMRLVPTTEPTYPTWDIDDGVNTPQWAIIREINWEVVPGEEGEDDDELAFYYSNYSPDVAVKSKADFDRLLKEVCDPSYVFTGGKRSDPKSPYATKLSLDSKEIWAYVIFKLARRKWQFSKKGRPIKFGEIGTNAKIYFNAHRVDKYGSADKGDDPTNIREDCIAAYFISDGRNVPAAYPYPHAFNLHVDLEFGGGGSGHMPNIIDPDVRHPGGSSE